MTYFIFNGKVLPHQTPIVGADNRGLRFGDGLFETLKYKHKQLMLADEHFARLWKGMQNLSFDIPKNFTADLLISETEKLLSKNNLTQARIRIAIYRSDGGLFDPKNNFPNYVIQTQPLENSTDSFNSNGLELCIYNDAKKSMDAFSNLKLNNFLPYTMGAFFAKKNKCNDAVILNSAGRVCETTIANIFTINQQTICTPALSEAPIAGVMRKFLMRSLQKEGFQVHETEISIDALLQADEVFVTNSISNIRWVGRIEDKSYSNTQIKKIVESMQQLYPEIIN